MAIQSAITGKFNRRRLQFMQTISPSRYSDLLSYFGILDPGTVSPGPVLIRPQATRPSLDPAPGNPALYRPPGPHFEETNPSMLSNIIFRNFDLRKLS